MAKRPLGIDVLTAAKQRIKKVFDDFPRIYASFSGGKDSGVMLHLVMAEARRRNRKIGVLFVDLEAQYTMTIEYVAQTFAEYADLIEPYWVALPIHLRNAVSQFEPQWVCWHPDRRDDWIREPHPMSITDISKFPFFRPAMEFEEFVPEFGHWYAQGKLCACFVGIRSDESLNRYRTIAGRKSTFEKLQWTTWCSHSLYNIYPIYDWRTEDIWTFNGKAGATYNPLYDRMHRAGLTIHQARICQPYGDDQRKGLWLFQIIEPETWAKIIARVNGANQGALYAQKSGNILGQRTLKKPAHLSWREFAELIMESMPALTCEHYSNKIAVFLKWYADRGFSNGIPDAGSLTDRSEPSWARICKALLRNDYWCKGLSFSQNKTTAYEKYMKIMKKRRQEWHLV